MTKPISQKEWKRGIIANCPDQDQPKGSLPRASNLIYTRRGGLKTCDGSLIISQFNGVLAPGSGPWTELFLFQPVNVNRYYIGIQKGFLLGAPVGLASADGGAGGTLGAGTYRYVVTASDGVGGETTVSNETTIAIGASHFVNLTWTAKPGATTYTVYRTVAGGGPGTETQLAKTVGGAPAVVSTNAFQDDGSWTPSGVLIPPFFDTTQLTNFFRIPAPSYTLANLLATFPADPFVAIDGTPGGLGGGGGTTNPVSGAPPSPQGGNTGNTSPLPVIVQFANKAFLALGNGFSPQVFTDPTTVAALTNTFSAIYPDWVAAQIYNVGDLVKPSVNNAGGFVFKCLQGGAAGAGPVTWPQTQNQEVTDPKLLWQNIGTGTTSPAPRGAAHAEVYAGALWVANTSPVTTADNLDGPSALRMSDINNPTSWNPLNTAFLDRDDGDQVTGLKAMTIAESGIPPTGSLCAFKNFKTFQINGVFGSSDFSIQRAQTDLGCIASRTIDFCPGYGIVRLSHLGFALFDTTRDRVISEDIRPFLFADPSITDIQTLDWNLAYLSKAAQSADPPMYMAATPLSLANLNVTGGIFVAASTWTSGSYFFRATKFTLVNGLSVETAVSQEITIVLNTARQAKFILVTPDPTALKYRIYVAKVSGGYTNFIEQTPAQMAGSPTFSDFSQFTQAGSIQNGIGGLSRIFCYDLVQKAWAIIDLPFAISVLRQVRPPGSEPITIVGGFSDGSMRRLQAGDLDWDGTPINWRFRPAELMAGGGTARVFYQRLSLKGVGNPSTISLIPAYDYVPDISQQPTNYTFGNGRFLSWLDLLQTALTAHVDVVGTGQVEIDAVDWDVDPLNESVPPQFA